ncbi:MAG: ferritin [Phycisphaerales bacterium]|nr:MAG: ferritin [Phycisphaerales bacterium]
MLISKTMNQRLNDQINAELKSYYVYLAMSCRLVQLGLKVLAEFFARQSEEERGHAMRILKYIQEVGATVELQAVDAASGDYPSALAIARAALDQEHDITRRINALVTLAESEKDYATRSFLAWFVDEQVEEVSSMTDLVQLLELAGDAHLLQAEARIRHQMIAAGD